MNATNANCRRDDSLLSPVSRLQGPVRVPNGFPEVPTVLRGSGAAPVVNLNFRPGLSDRDVRVGRVPGLRLDQRPGWMRGDPRWTAGIVHPAGYTYQFELGTEFIHK